MTDDCLKTWVTPVLRVRELAGGLVAVSMPGKTIILEKMAGVPSGEDTPAELSAAGVREADADGDSTRSRGLDARKGDGPEPEF